MGIAQSDPTQQLQPQIGAGVLQNQNQSRKQADQARAAADPAVASIPISDHESPTYRKSSTAITCYDTHR